MLLLTPFFGKKLKFNHFNPVGRETYLIQIYILKMR